MPQTTPTLARSRWSCTTRAPRCWRLPFLRRAEQDAEVDSGTNSKPEFGRMLSTVASCRTTTHRQQLMSCGHARSDVAPLLGSRELDLVHVWPNSCLDINFDALLQRRPHAKVSTLVPPPSLSLIPLNSLSTMQRAFGIIHAHTFGPSQDVQLPMVIVRTAGTGKSYLINAICQLFSDRAAASALKVTAPTGIAAANIHCSTIFSPLSLLSTILSEKHSRLSNLV